MTVSLLVAGPDYATLTIHATNNHNIDNFQTIYSAQSGRFFANALSVMHLGFIRQSVAARWATCGRARQGLWHPYPRAMAPLPWGYGTPTLGLCNPCPGAMRPLPWGYDTPTQGLWHPCPGAMGPLPWGYDTPALGLWHPCLGAMASLPRAMPPLPGGYVTPALGPRHPFPRATAHPAGVRPPLHVMELGRPGCAGLLASRPTRDLERSG